MINKFISVAPLKRMPYSRCCFDYGANNFKLAPGDLVKVPFRRQNLFGLVLDYTKPDKNLREKIKPILNPVFEEPALSLPQVDFLKELSELYHTNLNFILRSALPPLQVRKIKQSALNPLPALSKSTPAKPHAFFSASPKEEDAYLKKNLPQTGQVLILVPTITHLKTVENISKLTNKEILSVQSDDSEKKQFADWFSVRNNPNAVVVGTRKALFLPWTNLTGIFMLDEGNPDYKSWDMAPRFHTRDAALILSRHFKAQLHLISPTPAVETYFFAKNKIYQTDNIDVKPLPNAPRIIDMSSEKNNKNFSGINQILIDAITNLGSGDVFLYLNNLATARAMYCPNCKKIIQCPACASNLSYFAEKKIFSCSRCKKETSSSGGCPTCRNQQAFLLGPGINQIKEFFKQLKIHREIVTIQKAGAPKLRQKDKSYLIIGTRYAWSQIDWRRIGLMAFLDVDSSLYLPEFKAGEELWQQIRQVDYFANKTTQIFLQTHQIEHPLIQAIPQPINFYLEELAQRKLMSYPPFNFMLKLTYGHRYQDEAERAAKQLVETLRSLTKNDKNVIINGPLSLNQTRIKNKFWTTILIKIGYDQYKTIIKKINKNLPDEWQVDPNPNKLSL